MFSKLTKVFNILNNSNDTYIGLTQLRGRKKPVLHTQKPKKNKDLKISDLMKGLN